MANVVACFAMSHAPQLMLDPDHWGLLKNREGENLPEKPGLEKETAAVKRAKWQNCRSAIARLREMLDDVSADTLLVVGDDQHENLIDDNMPPFTVFVGAEVEASTSLRYLKQPFSENKTRYQVDAKLAEALVNGLMDARFDPAYSKQTRFMGGLGHAFARVLKFLSPAADRPIVPVMVNTYYPPAPSARRCIEFGAALAEVLRRLPQDTRVAVIASGGLSHTKIDESLDRAFIEALQRHDLDAMAAMRPEDLVEGTSEIRNWIIAAAAAGRPGQMVGYVPLYRTTTGIGCAMGFAHWPLG